MQSPWAWAALSNKFARRSQSWQHAILCDELVFCGCYSRRQLTPFLERISYGLWQRCHYFDNMNQVRRTVHLLTPFTIIQLLYFDSCYNYHEIYDLKMLMKPDQEISVLKMFTRAFATRWLQNHSILCHTMRPIDTIFCILQDGYKTVQHAATKFVMYIFKATWSSHCSILKRFTIRSCMLPCYKTIACYACFLNISWFVFKAVQVILVPPCYLKVFCDLGLLSFS